MMNQFFLHIVGSRQVISVVSSSKSLSLLAIKPSLTGTVDSDDPKFSITDHNKKNLI